MEFASSSDVKRAIEKFDGYELEGKRLKVRDGSKKDDRLVHFSYILHDFVSTSIFQHLLYTILLL